MAKNGGTNKHSHMQTSRHMNMYTILKFDFDFLYLYFPSLCPMFGTFSMFSISRKDFLFSLLTDELLLNLNKGKYMIKCLSTCVI